MSYIVSALCVRLKCTGVAKAVLMQLADMANDQGYAWPTIETLCMRTDWGRTAVIDGIAWLEERHALEADRSNGRKTVYWLTPDSFTGERHATPEKLSTKQSARRTGTPDGPVREADPTSPPGGLKQSAKRTLTIKNHQEPSIPPTPKGGACANVDPIAQAYPAKRVDLGRAAVVWRAMEPSKELQAEILEAVRVMARTPQWIDKDGQYAPKLSRWLRNKGWTDPAARAPIAPPPTPAPTPAPALTADQMARNKQRAREALELARRTFSTKVSA